MKFSNLDTSKRDRKKICPKCLQYFYCLEDHIIHEHRIELPIEFPLISDGKDWT